MTRKREQNLRGIPVSAGFADGKALAYREYRPAVQELELGPGQVPDEVRRFQRAVKSVEKDLRALQAQVARDMGRDFADFIAVQLALLEDRDVVSQTEEFIKGRARNAEFAYATTLERLAEPVSKSTVPFFRERAMDVNDVRNRVLRELLGDTAASILEVEPGTVLVAHDLPPSEAALLDPGRVAGVVLEAGGKTSHTAIIAKAKEIPAVAGVGPVGAVLADGDRVFVDGYRGLVIARPTANRLRAYEDEIRQRREHRASLSGMAEQEPVTTNGKVIDLSANIEFLAEAHQGRKYGARGVGLFRTEYMFLARRRPPSEDEQFEVYAEVARMFKPYPVIIRTFDLGGDKVVAGYQESNPFLGFRAIRLCLEYTDIFRDQLRAILRASAFGNVKVMFPMVATLEELRRAKLLVDKAKKELRREGTAFDDQLEVGVMVEIPSAAIMADRMARECSFLSIGSNDLTQYTLAVDRGNEHVAKLYDPFHPSVLYLIKRTIDAAHGQGIWVGLCGEFASDPLGVVVLLGMGIDEMSVTVGSVPETKNIIRSVDTDSAAEIVAGVMKLGTALEVQRFLRRELDRRFPKLAESLFQVPGGGREKSG